MTITAASRSEQRNAPTAAHGRPVRRPPAGVRAVVGVLALGSALFNVALMLSDRAPSLSKRLFGDFAIRLSNRLDAPRRVVGVTDGRTPESDAIVHVGVWAVATVLVGLAVWRWWGLVVAAITVFAFSVFVEVGQGRYSATRAVEMKDVLANGFGVAGGTVACIGCYLAWSAVASVLSAIRRP